MKQTATALLIAPLFLGACSRQTSKDSPQDHRPTVKVARPTIATLADSSEHTGRAQAVDSVEVRPRASGHLLRALFKEGDLVEKNALLFIVDPRSSETALARLRADLNRARADEELARRERERAERLFATSVISDRDIDVQRSTLRQAEARTQSATAAVRAAELDVEYCFVRAPIAGRIGRIAVTPGNLVGPDTPLALTTLVSVDPLHVYVDVDEVSALRITRFVSEGGRAATVGFVDEIGHPHEGKIDFIDNRVDQQTGTQKLRVVVRNEGQRFSPGVFARVRLSESEPREMLMVSDRAIGTDQDRRYVLVVDRAGKVQYRTVKLGGLHEGMRVVREGLNRDDEVIIAGLQRVKPGAEVTTEPAAGQTEAPTSMLMGDDR